MLVSTDPSAFKNSDEIPPVITNEVASNAPVLALNFKAVLLWRAILEPVASKPNTGKQVSSASLPDWSETATSAAAPAARLPAFAHATPVDVEVRTCPALPVISSLSVIVPEMSIFVTSILGVPDRPAATPGVISALPSNDTPPMFTAVASAVAVAALPVQDPDEPDALPVKAPLKVVALTVPVTVTPASVVFNLSFPSCDSITSGVPAPPVEVINGLSPAAFLMSIVSPNKI